MSGGEQTSEEATAGAVPGGEETPITTTAEGDGSSAITPQVHLTFSGDDGKSDCVDTDTEVIKELVNGGGEGATGEGAAGAADSSVVGDDVEMQEAPPKSPRASSRQPHVLLDEQGNEKMFGSALGLLTRKFVDLVQSSQSGAIDMNESAIHLQVPKRRIYDITNVLEGVGILEKRSKNTVAWKGSELILGNTIDAAARKELDRLRAQISALHKEEALMDQWVSHLMKSAPNMQAAPISTPDIIQALYYPVGQSAEMGTRDMLVDETGKPRRAILAVHAPYDSVAYIPCADNGTPERQLYVGTKAGMQKFDEDASSASTSKKRSLVFLQSRKGVKLPRRDDKVQVYVLSMFFDENDHKLKASDMKILSDDPDTIKTPKERMEHPGEGMKRSSSWEVAESLANDEGVSEFFGAADEETELDTV